MPWRLGIRASEHPTITRANPCCRNGKACKTSPSQRAQSSLGGDAFCSFFAAAIDLVQFRLLSSIRRSNWPHRNSLHSRIRACPIFQSRAYHDPQCSRCVHFYAHHASRRVFALNAFSVSSRQPPSSHHHHRRHPHTKANTRNRSTADCLPTNLQSPPTQPPRHRRQRPSKK